MPTYREHVRRRSRLIDKKRKPHIHFLHGQWMIWTPRALCAVRINLREKT